MPQLTPHIKTVAIGIFVMAAWKFLNISLPSIFISFNANLVIIILFVVLAIGVIGGVGLLLRKTWGWSMALFFLLYILFGGILTLIFRFDINLFTNSRVLLSVIFELSFVAFELLLIAYLFNDVTFQYLKLSNKYKSKKILKIGLIAFLVMVFNLVLVYSSIFLII